MRWCRPGLAAGGPGVEEREHIEGVDRTVLVEITLGTFDIMLGRITREKLEHSPPDIYIPIHTQGIQLLDFGKAGKVWEQCRPAIEELRSKLRAMRNP